MPEIRISGIFQENLALDTLCQDLKRLKESKVRAVAPVPG